jgi:hypothetical protein
VVPLPLFTVNDGPMQQFDAGDIVRGHRSVLRAYADKPASLFSKVVESLWQTQTQNPNRLKSDLGRAGAPAREAAIALSALAPDSPEAKHAFFEYCRERRLVDLAMDFARFNGTMAPSNAMTHPQRATAATALSWASRHRFEFPRTLGLTDALRGALRVVAPLRQHDLLSPADSLVAYPFGLRTQIVKAAAACPPGTRSLRARATIDPRAGGTASVAIAVTEPDRRLAMSEDAPLTDNGSAWSGWLAADGSGKVELRIDLAAATGDLLDLYLLSRPDQCSGAAEALVIWTAVEAIVASSGGTQPSAVGRRTQLTAIGAEAMSAATLLTDDPALRLLADDGTVLTPQRYGDVLCVALGGDATALWLISRRATPADLLPDSPDTRRLGVALCGLRFDGVEVKLTDACLCRGWHEPEPGLRWTDGTAVLEVSGIGVVELRLATAGLRYVVPPVLAPSRTGVAA